MFPHTITIYHHEIVNNADTYQRTVLSGVYWYGGTSLSSSNKGIDSKGKVNIITNVENARNYGAGWTVNIGDKVVLGEGGEITSLKSLINAITVTDIAVNVCNSDVDNITIAGV